MLKSYFDSYYASCIWFVIVKQTDSLYGGISIFSITINIFIIAFTIVI